MAENAARVAWAGAGVSLPRRLTTARGVKLAVRKLLADSSYSARAKEFGRWAAGHDGAAVAADELERFAASRA
jgi:UDP:flavonoid glycosyltransferase YjiC (YdhE family)